MSIINFVDFLSTRGRKYQQFGLEQEAAACWSRLAGLPGLPPDLNQEAQTCLAELHIRSRRLARARRQLTAALVQQPDNARLHYLLATALEADPKDFTEQALRHYRRAVDLAPEQADHLYRLGRLALELGRKEEGLRWLRRAADKAHNNPEIIAQVAEALEPEAPEEAHRILALALFRQSRNPGLRKAWNDLQFRSLSTEQARQRRSTAIGNTPVLLPFVRVASAGQSRHIRRDAPAPRNRPHIHARLSDKKHA